MSFLGGISDGLHWIYDKAVDLGGHAVGEIEEHTGVAFPVRDPYQEKVSDTLRRGSMPSAADLETLQRKGFKSVVNLCLETNSDAINEAANGLTLNTLGLPVEDNRSPTVGHVVRFLDFIRAPKNQPAYVHCQAGVGRTGVFVACYRMAVEGVSPEKALKEATDHGLAMPNQKAFILELGRMLAARRTNPALYPLLAPYPLR
jgi:protein-tyrosine phosphatase